MSRRSRLNLLGATLGLAWAVMVGPFLIAATPTAAHERGRCVSAEIADPMILPDGSEHPGGSLRICVLTIDSPISGLHETQVDGRSIGLYISRRVVNELHGPEQKPFFLFYRDRAGHLVLQGYAMAHESCVHTYLLAPRDRLPVRRAPARELRDPGL